MNANPVKVLLLGTAILVSVPRGHAQADVLQAGLHWTPATLFPPYHAANCGREAAMTMLSPE